MQGCEGLRRCPASQHHAETDDQRGYEEQIFRELFHKIRIESAFCERGLALRLLFYSTPVYRIYWWLIAFPGGVLVTTLLALNFLGDGLRDAWDVKSK